MAKRTYILDEPEETMAMLKADQQRVRELFQHYAHTREPHLRQQMAAHVLVALELYTLVEETVFFPACVDEPDPKGEALVGEAREEHQRIRELIAALRPCDPEDVARDPRFHELMDAVSQHV
jgi:hypothetical protein